MANETTQYGLYFDYNNTTIRIPVNPQSYTITYPTDNTKYNILDLGEINRIREPGLAIIQWDSYLPANTNEPFVLTTGNFRPPAYYIEQITKFMKSKEPVRFIANRINEQGQPIFDTNIQVSIEEFEQLEQGGETGDFYYSISLLEYREFNPQIVNLVAPATVTAPTTATNTEQRDVPKTQICVGDTVIANGRYYYDSYGSNPYGNASNLEIQVTRIVANPKSGQNYPYHIGQRGWLKLDQLRKV